MQRNFNFYVKFLFKSINKFETNNIFNIRSKVRSDMTLPMETIGLNKIGEKDVIREDEGRKKKQNNYG